MIIPSVNYAENKGIKCINKAVTMSSLGQGPLGMNLEMVPSGTDRVAAPLRKWHWCGKGEQLSLQQKKGKSPRPNEKDSPKRSSPVPSVIQSFVTRPHRGIGF